MVTRLARQLVAPTLLFVAVMSLVGPIAVTHQTALADQSQLRTRRDIREVEQSPEELKNLRHAFFMLRKQPPTCDDPSATSEYDCWAAYHNNFIDYGCRHLSDLFWPWHRYHLVEFEKALRRSDPVHPERVANVTLPYWNWSQAPSGNNFPVGLEKELLAPSEFYPEDCPDPANCVNPLWAPNRRSVTACQAIKEACVKEALDLRTWSTFAGGDNAASAFELQAHNFMHSRYINGLMGSPSTAARDPIYWLFHAYIDRVWDQWQTQHQANPCAASNVPDTGRTLALGDWPPANVRFQDVLCTSDLEYQYSDGPPTVTALANCPANNAPCASDTSETPVVLTSTLVPSNIDHAELLLEGVTLPSQFSYDAWVLLHPASRRYRPKDRAFVTRYAATSFSAWRNDDHHRSGDSRTMRIRLDVTRGLRELVRRRETRAMSATIVFVTDKSERAAPLVFRKDVDLSTATLVIEQRGQRREVPLALRQ